MAKMPGVLGVQPTTPEERTIATNALVKNKRKKGRNKKRGKAASPTTVYRGGEKFESY